MEWVKALHVISVIAWMAGMLYLPRLYVYHTRATPGGELDLTLQEMERKLLRIIINPAMNAAWIFGVWMILIHVYGFGQGWGFLLVPWVATKLVAVIILSGWHGFLAGELKRIHAGTSARTGKFWRMTNEIPFLIAIVAVLAVTTEGVFG